MIISLLRSQSTRSCKYWKYVNINQSMQMIQFAADSWGKRTHVVILNFIAVFSSSNLNRSKSHNSLGNIRNFIMERSFAINKKTLLKIQFAKKLILRYLSKFSIIVNYGSTYPAIYSVFIRVLYEDILFKIGTPFFALERPFEY